MVPDVNAVTEVVLRVGKIAELRPEQDMYEAGVSSIDSLELLLELESTFDVSIPDDAFVQARTPEALLKMIQQLQVP